MAPFRSQLKTAHPEEISLINTISGREVDVQFAPADDEILKMDLAYRPDLKTVDRWLDHPDERVVLAYVTRLNQNNRLWARSGKSQYADHQYALKRILARQDAEGMVWSMLLEKIHSKLPWQHLKEVDDSIESMAERISRLAPWLETHATQAEIRDLLSWACPEVLRAIARHIVSPSVDILEDLKDKGFLSELARNPNITGDRLDWVMSRVLISGLYDSDSRMALGALNERGIGISKQVFDNFFLNPGMAALEKSEETFPTLPSTQDNFRAAAVELSNLTSDQLDAFTIDLLNHGRVQNVDYKWMQIGTHPAADITVAIKCIDGINSEGSKTALIDALIDRTEIVEHPDMIPYVRKYGSWQARARLFHLLGADDLRKLEQDIFAASHFRIQCWLNDVGAKREIPSGMLKILLSHPNQEVRLSAIAMLSESRGKASDPQPRPGNRGMAIT